MVAETQLDNLLVQQKDHIIGAINDIGVRGPGPAAAKLAVVRAMWASCDYEYKWKELVDRLNLELLFKDSGISYTFDDGWLIANFDGHLSKLRTT